MKGSDDTDMEVIKLYIKKNREIININTRNKYKIKFH